MTSPGQAAYEAYWRKMTDSPDGAGAKQAWDHVPPWAQAAWEAAADAAVQAGHPDPDVVNAVFDAKMAAAKRWESRR